MSKPWENKPPKNPKDGPDTRKTCHGVPVQELIDRKEREIQLKQNYLQDLQKLLLSNDPKQVTFVIINFSTFNLVANLVYIPAEVGMTAFNIINGIVGNLSSMIDPYSIPLGFGIEAMENSTKLGVPYPPFDNRLQDYRRITRNIEMFVDRFTHPKIQKKMLFCLADEAKVVRGCMAWLYKQQNRESPFEVYSLGEAMRFLTNIGVTNRQRIENKTEEEMVRILIQERHERDILARTETLSVTSEEPDTVATNAKDRKRSTLLPATTTVAKPFGWSEDQWECIRAGVFSYEKQVDDYLQSLNLALDPAIGCIYHYNFLGESDMPYRLCPLNVTNRYAYNMLDILKNIYKGEFVSTRHVPSGSALKEIRRREELLIEWGFVIKTNENFICNPDIPPKERDDSPIYKIAVPKD